jgi:ATP-dependent helicase/nuclease subunit B
MHSTDGTGGGATDAAGPRAQAPGVPLRLPRDARWWPGVAALVRAQAGPDAGPGPACDLRRVQVIVPRMLHAPLLRAALHAALDGRACMAPRIQTLEEWAGLESVHTPPQRAELFEALRANAWVRERFGAHAGALWSLARDIALLGDELTLAACGAVDAFTGRWRAAVQRHFTQRAAAAGEPQAQLVLALWRAGLHPERGAVRLGERLAQRAAAADGPLLWLVPQGAAPWQSAYCQAYTARSGHAALLVAGDDAALAARCPLLAAAWPELAGSLADAPPIAERAAALGRAHPYSAPRAPPAAPAGAPSDAGLQIWRCNSLEEEAAAAAAWTVDRLRAGAASLALVALDRLAARRVRALLDRAGVTVADEAGWKLSTTSAAAALMRWLDLVIADFAHGELLDWLQSPFTLAGAAAGKTAVVAAIAAALLDEQVHAGAGAVRAAVARRAQRPGPDSAAAAEALLLIDTLSEHARLWQQAGPLGRYLGLLDAALDQLGMRAPLAADPVGGAVLEAVAQLREQLAGSGLRLDLREFRAFLAEHLEEMSTAGAAGAAAGPVVMTTLAGTRLRHFEAALLIGADADHLPGRRGAGGLLAGAVRRELGLHTDAEREREQMLDLASLLATTPAVAATWRQRDGDAPRPLSPLLDRLVLVSELSGGGSPLRDPQPALRGVAAAVGAVPAPRAAGRLPPRLSATAYKDLVDCPYRFFALRMLGLREAERLRPVPDKRDLGKVLHRALHDFHRGQAGLARGAVAAPDSAAAAGALRATIDGIFAPLLRQQPALIAYRQRLRLMVPGYLQWLAEDQRQGWRWSDGEAALERPLPLADAAAGAAGGAPGAVMLFGRVDRIDAGPAGTRILDFKTRDAGALRREQKDPGEAVQLLFYGLLLDPPPAEAAYLSLQAPRDPRDPTAGVATQIAAPAPFAQHVALLGERIALDLRRIGAGAPLPASGAETVCRRCELRSLCRHGFTRADGVPADVPAAAEPGAGSGAAHE